MEIKCVAGEPCRKVRHPDDYSIGGVDVHLNVGGAWTCEIHGGVGEDGSILVDWGTTEISLDAIAAVREMGRDARDGTLPDDVAELIQIRTPVRVSVVAQVNDDLNEAARRRLATRLAGVVLARVDRESDLDLYAELDLRMTTDGDGAGDVSCWPTDPDDEAALIDRAGWMAAALLSPRGSALVRRAGAAGLIEPGSIPHAVASINTTRWVYLAVGFGLSGDWEDSEDVALQFESVESAGDADRLIAMVERDIDSQA